jgi:hypothetical protein
MESTVGVPKLAIILHAIDLQGTTNYTMITKALREWNKANGEDGEKSILLQMALFDEYFEG